MCAQDAVDVYDHEITVNAESYLVKTADLAPSGESLRNKQLFVIQFYDKRANAKSLSKSGFVRILKVLEFKSHFPDLESPGIIGPGKSWKCE